MYPDSQRSAESTGPECWLADGRRAIECAGLGKYGVRDTHVTHPASPSELHIPMQMCLLAFPHSRALSRGFGQSPLLKGSSAFVASCAARSAVKRRTSSAGSRGTRRGRSDLLEPQLAARAGPVAGRTAGWAGCSEGLTHAPALERVVTRCSISASNQR